ncbi:unnamed protein product, partial [marine sediment metagenome]
PPGYGDGLSETNLGHVLAELHADDVTVATKVRLSADDLKDTIGSVQRSLETSLKRLRRDSIDILQLHTQVSLDRSNPDWQRTLDVKDVLGKGGVADAFDKMCSQGLIRFLGFTGVGETSALHQVVDSGRFDLLQVYYNLLNPSAGLSMPPQFTGYDFRQLIDAASEHDLGVVVIRVMAGGALGGTPVRPRNASPTVDVVISGNTYEVNKAKAEKLNTLVSGDVDSLPQAALRFTLIHPGVSTVLVGFSSLAQIEEAVIGAGKGPLPVSAMDHLRDIWA